MTVDQAKKIISLLAREWRIRKKNFLLEIIDFLDKNINKKISFYNGFEFSLIEEEPKIRLLHLDFWQPNLSIQDIKKIIKKRETVIASIFQQLNRKFNSAYNLSLLQSFFRFNEKTGLWPIQFGLEYQNKKKPKIKVYLGINKDKFPLKNFCREFCLDYKLLKQRLKNKKFDTVAVDFLPNSDYDFKFYPLITQNKGLLYRANKASKIVSVKTWLRFLDGLSGNDEQVHKFIKLPAWFYRILRENNFKIHYFCKENDKKSIYFR